MGALENITERIKKDAKKKATETINQAKSDANDILLSARKTLDREKKNVEMETEKTIKIQRNRAISEGKLEARKMMLNAKEEVISRAFELTTDKLRNLDTSQKEQYLGAAMRGAVKELGGDVFALCNARDQATVSKIASVVDSRIKVSSEGVDYLGGVVIKAKDGSAQINATFEGVLERKRNDLRKEVAEILFGSTQKENTEE